MNRTRKCIRITILSLVITSLLPLGAGMECLTALASSTAQTESEIKSDSSSEAAPSDASPKEDATADSSLTTQKKDADSSSADTSDNTKATAASSNSKATTAAAKTSTAKATTNPKKVPKKVLKKWKKGFHKYKGNRYYCKRKGKLGKGWKTIQKKRYYFNPTTGAAAKYQQAIKGKKYYFTKSGVMKTGWVKFKNGKRYYKKSGIMATGVVTIKKKEYYFDPADGLMMPSKCAYEIPVLTFHRITSDKVKDEYYPNNEWVARISDFKEQMKYLHDNGYQTLSMDEFYDWYANGKKVGKKSVVLTFDDGDYEFYHLVAPVLKEYSFKATMFVIGEWTTDDTQPYTDTNTRVRLGYDLINKMKTDYPDLNIQCHSYALHKYATDVYGHSTSTQLIYTKTLEELENDFATAKEKFKEGTGEEFKYIAWPYGKYNDTAKQAFLNSGYRLAFRFGVYKYSNGRYRKARRTDSRWAINRLKVNGNISMATFKEEVKLY